MPPALEHTVHISAHDVYTQNLLHFRIFSHVSVSTKESQDYASWDRQSSPATILLCGSKSSQSSLVPKEHQMFMEEAYNSGEDGLEYSLTIGPSSPTTRSSSEGDD